MVVFSEKVNNTVLTKLVVVTSKPPSWMLIQLASLAPFLCHRYVILAAELSPANVAEAVLKLLPSPIMSWLTPSPTQIVNEAVVDIVPPEPILGTKTVIETESLQPLAFITSTVISFS